MDTINTIFYDNVATVIVDYINGSLLCSRCIENKKRIINKFSPFVSIDIDGIKYSICAILSPTWINCRDGEYYYRIDIDKFVNTLTHGKYSKTHKGLLYKRCCSRDKNVMIARYFGLC